jgi:hypothetical protein
MEMNTSSKKLLEAVEALCAAYGNENNLAIGERIIELAKLAKKARKDAEKSAGL